VVAIASRSTYSGRRAESRRPPQRRAPRRRPRQRSANSAYRDGGNPATSR